MGPKGENVEKPRVFVCSFEGQAKRNPRLRKIIRAGVVGRGKVEVCVCACACVCACVCVCLYVWMQKCQKKPRHTAKET